MNDQIRAPRTPEQVAAVCGDGVDLEISDEHEPGVAHGCPEGCPVHCWGGPDVPDDTPYPAWATDATDGIDTPGCDCGHDGMGPGWHVSCAWRQQVRQRESEQRQPQDGPHAPQDGPRRPDAGAETPEGTGGRQTDAEGRETLREQIAAAIDTHGLIHLDARMFGDHNCCADAALAALEARLDIGEEQAWCKACRRVWEGKAHRCESDAERQLADERAAYRSRTGQWQRVVHDRERTEELCRQLAAALTEVLAQPRIPDSGGDTAVHIGPVKCVQVERWRGVLKAAGAHDDGPSVADCREADRAWPLQQVGE